MHEGTDAESRRLAGRVLKVMGGSGASRMTLSINVKAASDLYVGCASESCNPEKTYRAKPEERFWLIILKSFII